MLQSSKKTIAALIAAGLMGFAGMTPVSAADMPGIDVSVNQATSFEPGGSRIIRVHIANPDIADIKLIGSHEMIVVGKQAGATTLITWDADGLRQEFIIRVGTHDDNLEYILQHEMGLSGVHVRRVGNRVLLTGTVENQYEHDLAVRTAALYVGGATKTVEQGSNKGASGLSSDSVDKDDENKTDATVDTMVASNLVEDMLEMANPSQINIEAQIIEISNADQKDAGLTYRDAEDKTSGTFNFGQSYDDPDGRHQHFWIFNHYSPINARLQALITNGKAQVLSRPNITTMSGRTAKILIGGQIPVPVKNGDNGTSVEWKDYGIGLEIKPIVDRDNNITADFHATVSSIDRSNAVQTDGFTMPALLTREAHAVVNVPGGMTMAIGGLMNSEDSKNIERIPILSKIPVLGEFFKHTSHTRDKRELLILLTPHLVNERTPANMSDKMKETYDNGRKEQAATNKVDLNAKDEPVDKVAPAAEETSSAGKDDGTILGKYLDRSVLPK